VGTLQRRTSLIAVLLLLTLAVASCRQKPEPKTERRFDIEGKIEAMDSSRREITLAHKEIPGFMKAMTMDFKVKDDLVFNVAKPGDYLHATLVVTDEGVLENVTVNQGAGAEPGAAAKTVEPQPGTEVPDFEFVDQDGRRVSLSKLRGGPVLLTFIYTRCPLPDYCIRMSSNFGEVAKTLKAEYPDAWKKAHLVSLSFDTEYDKPKVLKDYGKSYAGQVDPKFEHWLFAGGTADGVKKAADYFGLVYSEENGQYIHSLRTALIAPDGKLVALYRGNDWKPAEIAAEMAKAK